MQKAAQAGSAEAAVVKTFESSLHGEQRTVTGNDQEFVATVATLSTQHTSLWCLKVSLL